MFLFVTSCVFNVIRGHFEVVSETQVRDANRKPVADNVQKFLKSRLVEGKARAPLHLMGKGTGSNTLALQSFGNVRASTKQVRQMKRKCGLMPERR